MSIVTCFFRAHKAWPKQTHKSAKSKNRRYVPKGNQTSSMPGGHRSCLQQIRAGGYPEQMQADHIPPNSAYKGTRYELESKYEDRPAFPLEARYHQFTKGNGGWGGHASSSSCSIVSMGFSGVEGYNSRLRKLLLDGKFYEAFKMDLIDKKNLARMHFDDPNHFNERLIPAASNAHKRGWLSDDEYYDILFNYLDTKLSTELPTGKALRV